MTVRGRWACPLTYAVWIIVVDNLFDVTLLFFAAIPAPLYARVGEYGFIPAAHPGGDYAGAVDMVVMQQKTAWRWRWNWSRLHPVAGETAGFYEKRPFLGQ
ncbi:MAG: hypothetical protein H6669_14375 [Ardenticatenaceae bacterium]|nr:hypothetical protein [Ardenticatenaceae bacterium]